MRFINDGVHGFQLAFRGAEFLRQHPALWKWASLPAVINLLVFSLAFAVFLNYYPAIHDLATGFFYPTTPDSWYGWIWVAPLRFLALLIGLILIAAALVILYFTFLLLGTAVAAPFLDVLAQRVEEIATGRITDDHLTLRAAFRSIGASIVVELKKLGFFLGVQLVLFLLGLIPIFTPFTVLAATLFTILFLPLEYAGFAMDHRHMTFAARRQRIWQHRWLMLGFGAAAFLTLLIPLLNFICLPVLVVSGTLLLLQTEENERGVGTAG